MNKPVRYTIAKLLKEKGFNEPCNNIYAYGRENHIENLAKINNNNDRGYWLAPTIADLVMWFYEKHGIWISVNATEDLKSFWYETRGVERIWFTENYNSPIEAYEAAFEHTLMNTIL